MILVLMASLVLVGAKIAIRCGSGSGPCREWSGPTFVVFLILVNDDACLRSVRSGEGCSQTEVRSLACCLD